jgi:hypothetical protein
VELFKANQQWKFRPDDEKFASLQDLHNACKGYAQNAREKNVAFADLRADVLGNDIVLKGRGDTPARLTNWAFGQLCARVEAPASYLRELPNTLVAQNINYGLKTRIANTTASSDASLLFHENGSLLLRSLTTDKYARIWNWEITERLLDLQARLGWQPAGVDIRQKSDDNRENFDLYASDHDMFAFLCNTNLTVEERNSDGAVYKGIIVSNSEVGASSLKFTKFLYREKCGNHIIWGASKVMEINIRHVGDAIARSQGFVAELRKYAEESVSDLEAKIASTKTRFIGNDKQAVLDAIFGKRINGLSKEVIEAGYDACIEMEDGSPRTVWGMVQGLTRHSQTLKFADKRTDIDRAAGKLVEAF